MAAGQGDGVTADREPRAVLAGIPGWAGDDVRIEPLPGGLTNRSYRVRRRGVEAVLRLDAQHTREFGLDRAAELTVLGHAAAAGVAPGVLYAEPEAGILLRHYVPGRAWSAADLSEPAQIEALAALLRRVHELPTSGRLFDAQTVAERYAAPLLQDQDPERSRTARRCVEIANAIPRPAEVACCHNDAVAANVIEGDTLKLIDWEYACDNDPLFDLAVVIGYHDLDDESARHLLDACCGSGQPGLEPRLDAQRRLFDALNWLWLANRECHSPDATHRARLAELETRLP